MNFQRSVAVISFHSLWIPKNHLSQVQTYDLAHVMYPFKWTPGNSVIEDYNWG
jgi:hypothetical protein